MATKHMETIAEYAAAVAEKVLLFPEESPEVGDVLAVMAHLKGADQAELMRRVASDPGLNWIQPTLEKFHKPILTGLRARLMTAVPLVKACTLQELLSSAHVVLIHHRTGSHWTNLRPGWLQMSFVDNGVQLVCRQDLPAEAILSAEKAVHQLDEIGTGVISHGWLAPGHPDPGSHRRKDIGAIDNKLHLFWDFLSLFQMPRSPAEEDSFRIALASMHVVYAHNKWVVYRLMTMPAEALNNLAYQDRGWCFFEEGVGVAGAYSVISIRDGKKAMKEKSPLPLPPSRFAAEIEKRKFTNGKTDANVVFQLYTRIFPTLALHKTLTVFAWEDIEVHSLLGVLDEFPGLRNVSIYNSNGEARVSEQAEAELRAVLEARGGHLNVNQRRDPPRLQLLFRTETGDTKAIIVPSSPLSMSMKDRLPVKVEKAEGLAKQLGIAVGWELLRCGDTSVTSFASFPEFFQDFKEALAKLPPPR